MVTKQTADEILDEQQRSKAAAFARSGAGQKKVVEEYRAWALEQHAHCRESVVTIGRWVDPDGGKRGSVMPGISSGTHVPPDGVIESNFNSRKERLTGLTKLLALCEALLAQLRQKGAALPEDYRESLEKLKAEIPDRNIMEIVRAPKPTK
jgi:hypothetical protein